MLMYMVLQYMTSGNIIPNKQQYQPLKIVELKRDLILNDDGSWEQKLNDDLDLEVKWHDSSDLDLEAEVSNGVVHRIWI